MVISDVEKDRLSRVDARPPLSEILNLHDFEVLFETNVLETGASANVTEPPDRPLLKLYCLIRLGLIIRPQLTMRSLTVIIAQRTNGA